MKNLKLVLAAVIFCMGMSANAQVEEGLKYGIKAGVNLSGFNVEGENDLDGKVGFNTGFFIEYNMVNNLYVLSGLELTLKGDKSNYKEGDYSSKTTHNPMYIQLPVHIGYKLGIAEDMALGIHAGPYFAYGIGGKVKSVEKNEGKTEKDKIDFFGKEDSKSMNMKPFDAGIGIGLDLDYKQFRIGAGYDLGLVNMNRSEDKDDAVKNGNFYLSVGYKF